jgi:hypothetical protein
VIQYITASEQRDYSAGIFLAAQGIQLRHRLSDWQDRAQTRFSALHISSNYLLQDTELLLSQIYFHALSIYLSGIYDYHPEFVLSTAVLPTLSQPQVEDHLSWIIQLTNFALRDTKLAGLLFLFPLRVAASRSTKMQYRTDVLRLIRMVRCKGFAISDLFELEIQALWAVRDAAAVSDVTLQAT